MKRANVRSCTFKMWKRGHLASVKFESPDSFRRAKTADLLSRDRIFAVDTESLTKNGKLETLLVPVHFHDSSEVIETPEGRGMLAALFDAIWRKGYASKEGAPSSTKQRPKRLRKGKGLTRDGDRETVSPLLSVWFNLPYDFGRLVADLGHQTLRSVAAGADSYRLRVSDRFDLEVRRMHFGSSSAFDWRIRDVQARTIVRLLGLDLVGYWKTSLAAAARAVGVSDKDDIESKIEGVYEKPFESFTEEEWSLFKAYGLGDVKSTLELYHATAKLLTTIDERVVRKTGIIPPSAPGASARIMFAKAFDCHPDIEEWKRYPAWADQMGGDAYFGGRVFSTRPGIHERMATLDLKSAYPFQLSLVPDPVSVETRFVREREGFNVDDWRGRYGVLYVSGESLDNVYPAFRVHDATRNGRLRYVAGPFANVAVTIPELVIGVLRGSLRVDRIHKGVVMLGSSDRSFLRAGVRAFFDIKENQEKAKALRDMAKLLANSAYGKLIEVQSQDYLVAEAFPMARFTKRGEVCASIAHVFAGGGPSLADCEDVYWGEDLPQRARAQRAYADEREAFSGSADERGPLAVAWYTQALALTGAPREPGLVSVAQYLQGFRTFKAGQFFMPLYAAQVTGATSAMVGLMASCLGALQGDTDSVHVQLPLGVARITQLDGYARYFEIMRAAGYESPREAKRLGSWEEETPEPSTESLLARTKLYSHRFADGTYKQAQHGISKFHSPELDAVQKGRAFSDVGTRDVVHGATRDERVKLAKRIRASALHEAIRALIVYGRFSYSSRPSPRKLREAVAQGRTVGEFVSRPMDLTLAADPNTTRDAHGSVRWKPLAPGEDHWAPESNSGIEEAAE